MKLRLTQPQVEPELRLSLAILDRMLEEDVNFLSVFLPGIKIKLSFKLRSISKSVLFCPSVCPYYPKYFPAPQLMLDSGLLMRVIHFAQADTITVFFTSLF